MLFETQVPLPEQTNGDVELIEKHIGTEQDKPVQPLLQEQVSTVTHLPLDEHASLEEAGAPKQTGEEHIGPTQLSEHEQLFGEIQEP